MKVWPALLGGVLRLLVRGVCLVQQLMHGFQPWGILLAICGFVVTLMAFAVDLDDRQSERMFRASTVVREFDEAARMAMQRGHDPPVMGRSLSRALEYLNREFDGRLCGIGWIRRLSSYLVGSDRRECLFPKKDKESFGWLYLPGAILEDAHLPAVNFRSATLCEGGLSGANLKSADLRWADLSDTGLSSATLVDADLFAANLSYAQLSGAMLMEADLNRANLRRASLEEADLADATLRDADVSGADFKSAKNLGQRQLDSACSAPDEPPRNLPTGRNWHGKSCPEDHVWRESSCK